MRGCRFPRLAGDSWLRSGVATPEPIMELPMECCPFRPQPARDEELLHRRHTRCGCVEHAPAAILIAHGRPLRTICAQARHLPPARGHRAGLRRSSARPRSVRGGAIHRVRHGAYVFIDHWAASTSRCDISCSPPAALRTARDRAVLSPHDCCWSLMACPIWDLPLDEVHVTRTDGRAGRREAGVVPALRRRCPSDVKSRSCTVCCVTSPARTAFDLTTITDVEHGLCRRERPVAHASSSTTSAARRHQRPDGRVCPARSPSISRSGSPTAGASRWASHGRCYMFWRGTPCRHAEPQYEISTSSGRARRDRVDFAWPELGVFLEFDGKDKYLKLPPGGRVGHGRRTAREEARGVDLPPHGLALHPDRVGRPLPPRRDHARTSAACWLARPR